MSTNEARQTNVDNPVCAPMVAAASVNSESV
jgi:hypothetical protein